MKIMKLFRKFSLPITAMLSVTMLLSSCGSTAESIGSIGSGSVGGLNYDSKERQILGQARGVGALVGAAAGAAIAENNGVNPIAGALVGGLLGVAGGDAVGKHQANKARNKRLSNDDMRKMIASVRANNQRLVDYNRKVARRIAQIKAAKSTDRSKMASSEYRSVKKAVKDTDKRIASLERTKSSLSGSQRQSFDVELRRAKSQRATLVSHSNELSQLASR
jgi:hypothetical protein